MNIVIIDQVGSPYDGLTVYSRALGGSESAVVFIAKELVKLGFSVTVKNDCNNLDALPGIYDGVVYTNQHINLDDYDVAISSRSVKPFHNASCFRNTKKIVWLHDTFVAGDELLESMVVDGHIDEVWTLSDWHTNYISQCNHGRKRMMEVLKRKIWVTRNGCNFANAVDIYNKTKNHFIYNASVSKGMETLLREIWPRVYERSLGQAKLTIIGGAYKLNHPDVQNFQLESLQSEFDGKMNVSFTGLISQAEVSEILKDAAYFIYPQSNPETYGISIIEAQAHGVPVITGRYGAAEETAVEDACYLMDYPVKSDVFYQLDEYDLQCKFVDMCMHALEDHYAWSQKAEKCLEIRKVCTWNTIALQWKQHLYKITGRYLSLEEYHRVTEINSEVHRIFNRRWMNPEENVAQYNEKERQIIVIVTLKNAKQYVDRCLDSIVTQNYSNYNVYIIDDNSNDGWYLKHRHANLEHLELKTNDESVGALANQLYILDNMCGWVYPNSYIVVLIDGDDALVNDNNIFKKINRLYAKGAKFTYGSCLSKADNIKLVAQNYPAHIKESKDYKNYHFSWYIPYTHLRTFEFSLYLNTNKSDFVDADGNVFKAAGDAALFYALIKHARPEEIVAVKEVLYLYNDENPNNDYKVNGDEQERNAKYIIYEKDTDSDTNSK